MQDGAEFSPFPAGDVQRTAFENSIQFLNEQARLVRYPSEHIHINDSGYGHALARLDEEIIGSDKRRVGLIVGTGAVLSSLPNIPSEVILIADNNPFIHDWLRFAAQAVVQAPTPEDYKRTVYSAQNPIYAQLKDNHLDPEGKNGRTGLSFEMSDLGDQHLLSSLKRFTACKEALQRKKLLYCAINIADASSMQELASAVNQYQGEITFANMTNVWEHAGNRLESSLPLLPFASEAVIIHSSRAGSRLGIPLVKWPSRGIAAYLESAKFEGNAFVKGYRPRAG